MNSVKITYLIIVLIEHLFFWTMAVITPIYLDEGAWWWSVVFALLSFMQGIASSKRFNSWDNFGSNE